MVREFCFPEGGGRDIAAITQQRKWRSIVVHAICGVHHCDMCVCVCLAAMWCTEVKPCEPIDLYLRWTFPPFRDITGSFCLWNSFYFVGITGEIGNVVTGNYFRGIHFNGITGKFGRVSAQFEAM